MNLEMFFNTEGTENAENTLRKAGNILFQHIKPFDVCDVIPRFVFHASSVFSVTLCYSRLVVA